MGNIDYAAGLLWYFVFLYSTVLHEAAHAWAALKLGDDTAYRGGQVSLDPIPHIRREPIGMVVVPIITFFMNATRGVTWMMGWASAPYDPNWAIRNPRSSAWMAMAGPASNLLLVIVSAILIRIGMSAGWFFPTAPHDLDLSRIVSAAAENRGMQFFATLLSVTFSLNLLLCLFNLLPLPPLDGSSIPMFFMSHEQCANWQRLMWSPGAQLIGMVIAWRVFPYIFLPVFKAALGLLWAGA